MSALDAVLRAWRDAGPAPAYHEQQKQRLAAQWPALHRALYDLDRENDPAVTHAGRIQFAEDRLAHLCARRDHLLHYERDEEAARLVEYIDEVTDELERLRSMTPKQ